MPLARHVLRKQDVSRLEGNLLPTNELDFSSSAERDHVLLPRRGMPIQKVIRRCTPELQPGHLDHLGYLADASAGRQLLGHLFGMRLAIGTGEDSCHLDRFPVLSDDDVVVRPCAQREQRARCEYNEDPGLHDPSHSVLHLSVSGRNSKTAGTGPKTSRRYPKPRVAARSSSRTLRAPDTRVPSGEWHISVVDGLLDSAWFRRYRPAGTGAW